MQGDRERLETLLSESVDAAKQRAQGAFDDIASPFENSLILFGAGGFGRRTLAGLRHAGIEPLAFTDNNPKLWGERVDGLPVMAPRDAAAEYGRRAAFVVTIWNGQGVDRMADRVRQLAEAGCERIVPAALLFWKYSAVFLPHYPVDLPYKLLLRADEVRAAYDLWGDHASRREYVSQVEFRLRLNYDVLASPGPEAHYFPPDLFRVSDQEVFVDCGAFDGDTITSLVGLQGEGFQEILAYEPDPLNWPKLQQTVATLPPPVREKVHCFQQAVGAAAGTVEFNSTGTDLSTMGSGTLSVECVKLDEVLRGHRPTMMKFDIEGAELDALAGGRETIARHLPLLAVSCYHQQGHLWEIPLSISAITNQYKYFLRPHGVEGWDLVCYAIPPDRMPRP